MTTQKVILPDGQVLTVTFNPQRVIPVKDVDLNKVNFLGRDGKPVEKKLFWDQLEDGSWYSARFGHRYPAIIVEDQPDGSMIHKGNALMRIDGPCQPYQPASPSAVALAYRVDEQGYVWYRGFLGYRPQIRDPKTGELGVITLQIFGGYSLGGEDASNTALRQALEEGGAILKNVIEVGAGSSNRMDTETCVRVFLAEYDMHPDGKKDDTAQGFEAILGDFEFRADQFPANVCFDLIVAAAFQYGNNSLGLISPTILN